MFFLYTVYVDPAFGEIRYMQEFTTGADAQTEAMKFLENYPKGTFRLIEGSLIMTEGDLRG